MCVYLKAWGHQRPRQGPHFVRWGFSSIACVRPRILQDLLRWAHLQAHCWLQLLGGLLLMKGACWE